MTKNYFYNENCFDTMAKMQAKNYKVEIVLTSPPYNTARTTQNQRSIDEHENRYDIHLDSMTDEQYHNWTKDLFENFDKILVKNGVVLYNISYGSDNPNAMWEALEAIRETNFMIADTIIWKKRSALPNNTSPNKLTRITEFVFVCCRKKEYKTFNANKKVTKANEKGQQYYENVFNFIEAPNNDGSCKLNKATFSSELVLKLLDIYAKPNDKIYDPFVGTGTTNIGCMKFNGGDNEIVCIGSELSENQVAYAKQRIKDFINDTMKAVSE